jgi:hypothetical protein
MWTGDQNASMASDPTGGNAAGKLSRFPSGHAVGSRPAPGYLRNTPVGGAGASSTTRPLSTQRSSSWRTNVFGATSRYDSVTSAATSSQSGPVSTRSPTHPRWPT